MRSELEQQLLLDRARAEALQEQLVRTGNAQAQARESQRELDAGKKELLESRAQALVPTVSAFLAREYPQLASEANSGVIADYLVSRHRTRDRDLVATDANIESAIQELGPDLSEKDLSDQEWRDYYEAGILERVVASSEERERERNSFHARLAVSREEMGQGHQKTGPYLVTTASMAQRLLNLKESERLRGLSHEELKAEVRGNAQQHVLEPLPGSFTAFNISSMSAAEWNTAIRKYGLAQLNARLAEQQAAGDWRPGTGHPIVTKERQ